MSGPLPEMHQMMTRADVVAAGLEPAGPVDAFALQTDYNLTDQQKGWWNDIYGDPAKLKKFKAREKPEWARLQAILKKTIPQRDDPERKFMARFARRLSALAKMKGPVEGKPSIPDIAAKRLMDAALGNPDPAGVNAAISAMPPSAAEEQNAAAINAAIKPLPFPGQAVVGAGCVVLPSTFANYRANFMPPL